MKKILLYLWQLPQNLLGLIILLIVKAKHLVYEQYVLEDDIRVYYVRDFPNAVSLGKYIFISTAFIQEGVTWRDFETERHEWGHTRQSIMFGVFYLLLIGLTSSIHLLIHDSSKNYYHFFIEKWATSLGEKLDIL